MAELVARVEKLEDFKAEQESLARVRVKGCPALLAAAQELDKGTKEFWKLKEQVGDLVWENLEHPVQTRPTGPAVELPCHTVLGPAMKGVDTAHLGLWVPLSAPEARRRKRKAGQEDSASRGGEIDAAEKRPLMLCCGIGV